MKMMMNSEFFPVTWIKPNPKPLKLPKALKGLTMSQWTIIMNFFQKK